MTMLGTRCCGHMDWAVRVGISATQCGGVHHAWLRRGARQAQQRIAEMCQQLCAPLQWRTEA